LQGVRQECPILEKDGSRIDRLCHSGSPHV
jgi:hypothetical protein